MKKKLVGAVAVAALGGSLFVVSPLVAVSAQEAETPVADASPSAVPAEATTTDEAEVKPGRRGHKGNRSRGGHHGVRGKADVAELLGVTSAELQDALSNGQSLADVAAANGVTTEALIGALVEPMQARIDAAVEAGRIDTAEAAEKLAAAEAKIAEKIEKVRKTETERETAKAAKHAEREAQMQSLADLVGTTTDELAAALKNGETLASVATANGVDPQAVIDALVAEAETRIDEKVAAGTIDAAKAAELKSGLVSKVEARVNEGRHAGRMGHKGKGKGKGKLDGKGRSGR